MHNLNPQKSLHSSGQQNPSWPSSGEGNNVADMGREVKARLEELRRLPANWDGYGARPIDGAIIDAAQSFIERLPNDLPVPPRVVPMSPGNLQLEWHAGSRTLELAFETPQVIHFLKWHPQEQIEEEDVFPVTDTNRALGLIQWFSSRTSA